MLKKFIYSLVFVSFVYFAYAYAFNLVQRSNSLPVNLNSLSQYKPLAKIKYQLMGKLTLPSNAFMEGLFLHNSNLYISSGLYAQSHLMKYSLTKHQVIASVDLPKRYFAEGITLLNHKIYQLTYLSNEVFVYNAKTLKVIDTFKLPFQGWGLTSNGKDLILSNGSSALVFINPQTHHIDHFVTVALPWANVGNINELEYIRGRIYANIYNTGIIMIINPNNGKPLAWFDITRLWRQENQGNLNCVPNGITYYPAHDDLLVGGKCWQHLYEIKLSELSWPVISKLYPQYSKEIMSG